MGKFVVLEKKSKEVLPKSNKKSKKKTQGNKKTVLPVSFSMEAPRSDRGRGGLVEIVETVVEIVEKDEKNADQKLIQAVVKIFLPSRENIFLKYIYKNLE